MKILGKELVFNGQKVYHTGDKPIASDIKFTDGKTFQQKLEDGSLKGANGANGATGATGPNTVTISTTTSGFTNGHIIYNNNGKIGAKALTAGDVGASTSNHNHDSLYLKSSNGTLNGTLNINTGSAQASTGFKINGSSGTSAGIWAGTGGIVFQSYGNYNLHLGRDNSTDMIFHPDKIELKKDLKTYGAKLIVDGAPAANLAHMTIYTTGDANNNGDGNTHIGYNASGVMTHYFRGKGRFVIDNHGSLEVSKPWVKLGGKWLTIQSSAPSGATGDVWIQI